MFFGDFGPLPPDVALACAGARWPDDVTAGQGNLQDLLELLDLPDPLVALLPQRLHPHPEPAHLDDQRVAVHGLRRELDQ